MRAPLSMLLIAMCVAALPAGAANSSFDQGIELRDVTLAGRMHFLAGFDSPFRYALSPERMRFAYSPVASGNAPSDELRISDIRGRDPVVVHAPADIVDMAWAPDGGPIALSVASAPPGENGIWLVQPDGSLHRVADAGYGLAWSPDSKELAMFRREQGSTDYTISVLTVATGAVRDVAVGAFPSWSPNGKSLLYTWSDPMGHHWDEIRMVPAQGGSPRLVAHGWSPTWSPDGKRIAFINATRTSPDGLWVMRINGGEGKARLLARRAGVPMWLPDSRRVAFEQHHRSKACGYRTTLSVVPASGGKVSRVVASKSHVKALAWNPKGRKVMYFKYACAGT